MMKTLLLAIIAVPFLSFSQVGYTVKVTQLMAKADNCDGGGLCLSAPQDPVFNIWVTDAESNENTNCWAFDNDNDMEFGEWNDIVDYELANESYVNTSYLSFDMGAFESDAISGISCSSAFGDDNVFDRAFNKLITIASMPMNVPYIDTISVGDMYYMEVEILWHDYASLDEISDELAVALSPNPSNGVFNIQLTENGINNFHVSINDISGVEIYSNIIASNQTTVDLSNHQSGTYFIKIITENRSIIKKVVLKN